MKHTGTGLLVLTVPALGALSIGCLLPFAALFAIGGVIALALWGGSVIDRFTSDRDLHVLALTLASVINGVGLLFTAASSLKEWFAKATPHDPGLPKHSFFGRHPWLYLGGALFLGYVFVVPGATYFKPRLSLSTAIALDGFVLWLALTSCYVAMRVFVGSVRFCWRIARASPAGAWAVILLGIITTALLASDQHQRAAADPRWAELARCGDPDPVVCLQRAFGRSSRTFLPSDPDVAPALYDRARHGALVTGDAPVAFANPGDILNDERRGAFESCLIELDDGIQREARQGAARFVGPAEAADVVQDVLIRVCLRWPRPRELRPYFIRSTQNRAREWSRRAALSCPLVALPEHCELRPDEDWLGVHFNLAVNKAFCALDSGEQEVVTLRLFEELEYPELAQRLGLTEAAARKRYSRALDKFERKWREMCW